MSHDDIITIHADILQLTDAAVLLECAGDEVWLPLSQIDFCGERGDTDVPITLPEWLGDDNGLSDGDGMCRATVTDFNTGTTKHEDDGKNCRNCALCEDAENAPLPEECRECTRSGIGGGTKDNWTDNGEEPDLPGDPPDTTRVTLTMVEFSEDGETVLTEDRHGNRWELSTSDFLQDGDDLDPGDTVLCYIRNSALAAEGCTLRPDEPEDREPVTDSEDGEDEPDTPSRPAETSFLKTETITVSVPLDLEERESVGDRMASALEKISELEDDLDSYRKSINAEIKSLQKDAEKARKEWQEGKIEQEVYCDVMADYDAEAIIWLVHDTSKEMKRRAMTAEERQYRLPIPRPGDHTAAASDESTDERPAPVAMGTPKTCITCGSLANRDGDELPETCQACAQANNGEDDNWHPIRECRTCIHSHTQVNMPPCAGCALNVEEAQRGDTDAWEWMDEESTDDATAPDEAASAPEADPESSEGGTEAPSEAVEEEPEAGEDIPTLAEEN